MVQKIELQAAAGHLPVRFTATVDAEAEVISNVLVEPFGDLPDTYAITFSLDCRGLPMSVYDITLAAEFSARDMHGLFHPYGNVNELTQLPFWRRRYTSGATAGPPLWVFLTSETESRVTIGLADQVTQTNAEIALSEMTRTLALSAKKPAQGVLRRIEMRETLLVSFARVPLKKMLAVYENFVDAKSPQAILPVPDCAYDPVFCTWTAIHTDVTPEWTERNSKLAAELGFKTLLMDDGWQNFPVETTSDSLAGGLSYPYLGDWRPNAAKFPDFAAHVRRIQAMGLRYLLWVAPLRMGPLSGFWDQFKDKGWIRDGGLARETLYLDPRYPAVIEFVRRTLLRLMRDYKLDGLKIDFIDDIGIKTTPEMAARSLLGSQSGPALMELLGSMVDIFQRDVPNLMIECRQGYSNLAARRWTNCYRSPDVPINFNQNRFNCAMLRLLVPDRAVYFDPALWPIDDSDENVARHMISSICAVPMISVEFDRYPASHLQMIRHWIAFYTAHRDTIIHGNFDPHLSLGHNPWTFYRGKTETILGLYTDASPPLDDLGHPLWILNASSREHVFFLRGTLTGKRTVKFHSRTGPLLEERTIEFPADQLAIEIGGSVQIV